MKVSNKGLIEIAEHEGIVPAPYLDSVGVLTFGIGHTAAAGSPNPASMPLTMPTGHELEKAIDKAVMVFKADVVKYAKRVNAAIKVPLAQHEFDALVSFDFNTGGIHRAKLTAAINAGDKDAARHFMGWLRPPEIRKRRTAEMNLFKTGDYDANGVMVPIWGTNGRGKLTGIIGQMDGRELLTRMGVKDVTPAKQPAPVLGTPAPAQPDPAERGAGIWAAIVAAFLALFGKAK